MGAKGIDNPVGMLVGIAPAKADDVYGPPFKTGGNFIGNEMHALHQVNDDQRIPDAFSAIGS
jgi:hypothetical protein